MVLMLLCTLARGGSDPWASLLPPPAVSSHLDTAESAVLVVGAGGHALALNHATEQVTAGLAASLWKATGDDDLATADDPSVLAMTLAVADGQPIDRVVVVRVFPAGEGWSVVASMYDRDGASVGGFAASTGHPLVVKGQPRAVTSGPLAEDRAVGFQRADAGKAYTGAGDLPGPKFYDYIGREELATQYRKRKAVKVAGLVPSLAAIVAGGTLAVVSTIQFEAPVCSLPFCVTEVEEANAKARRGLILGSAVSGAGLAVALSFGLPRTDPATPEERLRLADEYNVAIGLDER